LVFAHDTEAALQSAAALVNTAGTDVDELTDQEALDEFVRAWGWTGARRRSRAELDEVRALRPVLRRLWELGEDDVVIEVNRILRDTKALPQLVRHGEWHYHLHATPQDAPLADRMAVEAAMAFVDVIRQRELDRLRICDASDCHDVLVDLSKNRSRRYCSTACLNRTSTAAFRARHR
jgi:predicted RNA-binding Zn ribbon-like protein